MLRITRGEQHELGISFRDVDGSSCRLSLMHHKTAAEGDDLNGSLLGGFVVIHIH